MAKNLTEASSSSPRPPRREACASQRVHAAKGSLVANAAAKRHQGNRATNLPGHFFRLPYRPSEQRDYKKKREGTKNLGEVGSADWVEVRKEGGRTPNSSPLERPVSLHPSELQQVHSCVPKEISMDPTDSRHTGNLPESSTQSQSRARGLERAHIPGAEAGEVEATATHSGHPSVGDTLGSPEWPQRASSPDYASGPASRASSFESFGRQATELDDPHSPSQGVLNRKMIDVVRFLLIKYTRKQLTSKAQILYIVLRGYEEYYPVIFSKASDCLRLLFGLEIVERNTLDHIYSVALALGITYHGTQQGFPGVPKTGLLLIVLCIIFIEDNCASEQALWRVLNKMGVYADSEHFMYGEPRRLITEHFVQEGYLEYRQVPDSDPPSYEFLWGPRAHAETTKMKLLKFFASIFKQDPRAYPFRYAEALRKEIDRV
ncbi:melanoma-associated antigen 10-like [Acomys russatus]|uniref:melanoma-associated antigen 10-like n=1 Tax=Acomys russatus TaxID=60746 RepID=UPI0021E1FA16|nr:melanoma-associated antigen 10-like [Acomys russatus]